MRILLNRKLSRVILGYHILGTVTFLVVTGFSLFQPPELSASFPLSILIGMVFLAAGFWVFLVADGGDNTRLFSLFCTSAAIAFSLFPISIEHNLAGYLFLLTLGASLVFLASLAFHFPQKWLIFTRTPGSYLSTVVPALVLVSLSLPLFNKDGLDPLSTASLAFYWLSIAVVLTFIVSQAVRGFISEDPLEREQSRLVFSAAVIAMLPFLVWFGMRSFSTATPFPPSLFLPSAFFPPVMAYTLLSSPQIRPDKIRIRNLVYLMLGAVTVSGYALFVSGAALITGSLINEDHPLFLGIFLFLMAVLFNPLREKIQVLIDERYARRQVRYREYLEAYTKELTQATELDQISDLIRRYSRNVIRPEILHIYLYNPLSGQYEARAGDDGRQTSDLRFSPDSPIVQTLEKRKKACRIANPHDPPTALQLEKTRLVLLDVRLLIPLPGREDLVGWIGIGAIRSGETFTDEDVNYLETLSDQAALAIERTMVVADLERRMREMKILTRVSQGINVTLAFDDMLEMLYAQTFQVIQTLDFQITLREPYAKYLYHVFYLENDERLTQKENRPLSANEGLEEYVITSARPLVTDDYERECRKRGAAPSFSGIFAWMGIPLMAGADIIGVISLGNRRPTFTYSTEHVDLMKAIADQASGAIVKARLLQEAERRTKQLTLLNEVARSLTSTLAVDRLLDQILDNAVEILNCEAGSLLIPDEQTGEMVFKAAAGPVSGYFSGKRLPPGTGLIGKAFESKQPVVASDVRQSKEWYPNPDEQTGFITEDLLVVPMLVKERAIGVIEVINRKDKLPFSPDDVELLAAFASQAAIAIENARLYTLTDQALAARVEELSVMQRIDRELNATLDVSRAMQITLAWAMSQSEAEAGLVGMVNDSGISLMATKGYTTELDQFQDNLMPAEELPFIQKVLESSQPWFCSFTAENRQESLLKTAHNQFVIPIQREGDILGILLLENVKGENLAVEKRDFLARLCAHAAIAIANAQLYTELQAANLAKSDFISFVSHELKTPMTSIRGFTDLLAKGAVGPINENQANFLGTVRSNVDRMATLVSDLADLSRIESGRLRLEFSALSLSEIVEEVLQSCRAQMSEKKQELNLQLQADLPPVWGDRVRLVQILTNLMSNAIKYSPSAGQITVSARASRYEKDNNLIDVSPQEPAEVIHISVQDAGYGIDEEEQKNIFQKFFRSPDEKIRDMPGTGLGLNITKNLVEMQGGKIWFDSQFRKGTTFHFTIPASEVENPQNAGSI